MNDKILLSELLSDFEENYIVNIKNEQKFERFMRVTSASEQPACIYLLEKRYARMIPSNVTMVITTEEIAKILKEDSIGICISTNPKATFFNGAEAHNKCMMSIKNKTQIGFNCDISEKAYIAENNVVIGDNVIIEPFASIYENVKIGNNCIIRSGAKIGVEDYNYYRNGNKLIHLTHAGGLNLYDDVEIGYNTVVGKSLYFGDETIIGEGCKIANGCGIGHDVIFEDHVMIYAGTMVGGFVMIGSNTHIKMNCTIKNGTVIGKNVIANMSSSIIRNINEGEVVFGNPAKKLIAPRS